MRRIAATLLVVFVAAAAQATTYKIIVHPALNIVSLPAAVLSDVFMKKVQRWSNGVEIVPIDQSSGTVRDEFSRAVHGKTANAVRMYWTQQIYAGHGVPPVQKRSDADVVDFVKSTRGAIGYVSDAAVTDGVRVVAISPAP